MESYIAAVAVRSCCQPCWRCTSKSDPSDLLRSTRRCPAMFQQAWQHDQTATAAGSMAHPHTKWACPGAPTFHAWPCRSI